MPDRYLRAAILMSKPVNALSAHAELFYRRLMSVVDDYGRYEADPEELQPACFPKQKQVRETDISLWLAECESAGLILRYEVHARRFIWLLKTDKPRAESSKYPPHPIDLRPCKVKWAHADTCAQVRPYSSSIPPTSAIPPTSPPNPRERGRKGGGGGEKVGKPTRVERVAELANLGKTP